MKIDFNKLEGAYKLNGGNDLIGFLFGLYDILSIEALLLMANADEHMLAEHLKDIPGVRDVCKKHGITQTIQLEEILEDLVEPYFKFPDIYDKDIYVESFEELYFSEEDTFTSIISLYITDRQQVIKHFLKGRLLISMKWVEQGMKAIKDQCEITSQPYSIWYSCGCGISHKSAVLDNDIRSANVCCDKCGRPSLSWTKVSGRKQTLVRTIKRKFLPNTVKKYELGLNISEHEQIDKSAKKTLRTNLQV